MISDLISSFSERMKHTGDLAEFDFPAIRFTLEEMALEGVLHHQYSFDEKELRKRGWLNHAVQATKIGLIRRCRSSRKNSAFFFLHVSLQEYLAAYAVSRSDSPMDMVRDFVGVSQPENDREMFWLVLAELIPIDCLKPMLESLLQRGSHSASFYRSPISLALGCVEAAALNRPEASSIASTASSLLRTPVLDLSRERLSPANVSSLLATLNTVCNIVTCVRLRNCNLGVAHARALSQMPIVNDHTVAELDLSYNHGLTGEALWLVVSVLIPSQKIRTLDLRFCNLQPADGKPLRRLLEENKSIEKLILSGNQLSDTGIQDVLAGLANNTTLQTLDLSLNDVSPTSSGAIARALSSPQCQLRRILLQVNQLRSAGVSVILDSIRGKLQFQRSRPELQ